MTIRSFVWGIRLVTLFAICALGYVLIFIDPQSAGLAGKIYFYTALFLSASGMFNLFFIALRKKLISSDMAAGNLGISFRQGILMAVLITSLMVLQGFRMLLWWDGLLAVAGVFLVELYFLSRN